MDIGIGGISSSGDNSRPGTPDLSPREQSPERDDMEGVEEGAAPAETLESVRRELETARERIEELENRERANRAEIDHLLLAHRNLGNRLQETRNQLHEESRKALVYLGERDLLKLAIEKRDQDQERKSSWSVPATLASWGKMAIPSGLLNGSWIGMEGNPGTSAAVGSGATASSSKGCGGNGDRNMVVFSRFGKRRREDEDSEDSAEDGDD